MTDRELSGTLADRYEIVVRLGAGGMGEVYRARDQKLRRDVAIKRLAPHLAGDESHRRRFLREARSAARITHQGVAGLYDVVEEGDELYLVMEYVEGVTLRGVTREPREVDEAVRVMIEITEAIAAAHHEGVVHYDIKPGNLMLTPDGHLKVLDFGLAQIVARADPEGSTLSFLSESGNIAGTPPYMAPEVLLGKQADNRADLFSLGVVFYQLLTGKNPFFASTPTAVVDRILNLDPPPVVMLNPAVPESIQPILRKLLAKQPAQRYATADDLLVDLREVQLHLTYPSLTSPAMAPVQPPTNWWPVARLVAALVVVVAVGAALLWALDWPAGPQESGSSPPTVATRTVADIKSGNLLVTVLPLVEEDWDPAAAALARGLARRVITKLQPLARQFQLVHAGARPIDIDPDYDPGPIDSIAAARIAFGVDFVLVLDVQTQADRIEVTLGLVDAVTGRYLGSETVPGRTGAELDLGNETVLRALRLLQLELSAMEHARLPAGTSSEAAYGYFLTAEGYLDDRPDLAIAQAEQALRLDPEYAAAHALRGEALLATYRERQEDVLLERALEACDRALQHGPDAVEGHACRGRALVAAGRYEDAIPPLERAFRIAPTHYRVVEDLADANDRITGAEAAERVVLEALEFQPHFAPLHALLGYHRVFDADYEGAIEAFERTVQLAPDNYVAFSNLGVTYFYADRWSEAREAFDNTVRLNPDYYVAYSNAGTLTFFEGNYEAAASYYEQSLASDDSDYQVWHNLAESYRMIGRERETPGLFEKAAELAAPLLSDDPGNTLLRANLGYYLIMSGDTEAGQAELERAEREAAGDSWTLHSLAGTAQRTGDSAKALRLLSAAITNGYSIAEVRADPTFADLRGTPEWARVVQR